jgi:hypothetical protein
MMMPPIFTDENAEEALAGFEEKVHRRNMNHALKKAKDEGDIKELNQKLKMKRENRDMIIPLNK